MHNTTGTPAFSDDIGMPNTRDQLDLLTDDESVWKA